MRFYDDDGKLRYSVDQRDFQDNDRVLEECEESSESMSGSLSHWKLQGLQWDSRKMKKLVICS